MNWRSVLHAQRSKINSDPLGPSENKFLFLKTTKNAQYVRPLGKTPHFGAYTEPKKGVARGQVRSKGSPEAHKNANSSGLSEKIFIV